MSEEDHDAIVAMTVQVRQLCADMSELKEDVKVLKNEHHALKERVLVNGLKIGGMLTSLFLLVALFDEAFKELMGRWFS